jgi:ferredoxin
MADFETPVTREFPMIPTIVEGAMAHSAPYLANAEFQEAMGFPSGEENGQLIDGWKEKFLEQLKDKLSKYRSLQVFMDTCVKCGACTDKCHYFLGTADPKNMPVARQDLLRKIYRRYFTWPGKLFPWLVGAIDLTEETIDEMYSYYHQCSECRRCAVFCPFGIDTAEVTMAARDILASWN